VTRSPATARPWAIVLAGGEGSRLRPLVERIHSDGRPKQYAVLMGERSLLRQTLDRTALSIPPERTVVVTTRAHAPYFAREFSSPDTAKILVQPRDRGTAAGILLPLLWVWWRDPDATVAIFPSDHFVSDDSAFMRHVAALVPAAGRHGDRILLVGVEPDSPDAGYGWISAGASLEKGAAGEIRLVERFVEKPSPAEARSFFESGALWNTFVLVARASTLVRASRRALPELAERLRRVRPFLDTPAEAQALETAYTLSPGGNFSQSVLGSSARQLAVSRLPAMTWSDWGTPERVIETLRREGIAPRWLSELASSA
jgi:mannose-1-phosphate guanylyltransferase